MPHSPVFTLLDEIEIFHEDEISDVGASRASEFFAVGRPGEPENESDFQLVAGLVLVGRLHQAHDE